MKKIRSNPRVDKYISRTARWREETEQLRALLLDCGLTEDLKWGKPCYAFEGGNVVIIQGFKAYCALLFFKGVLLKDPDGILIKTGENSRVGRQIRFTNVLEITKNKAVLKTYIRQAIEIEKSGLKVEEDRAEIKIPAELQNKMEKMPAFKTAFHALTPGRQRAYIFHFSAPKQSQTREARIEKYVPLILKGRGINDDYLATKKN